MDMPFQEFWDLLQTCFTEIIPFVFPTGQARKITGQFWGLAIFLILLLYSMLMSGDIPFFEKILVVFVTHYDYIFYHIDVHGIASGF